MLDELALQIGRTLISEMQATDRNGNIDHKSRLTALKEARVFLQSLLPKLSREDRDKFSNVLTSELTKKMEYIKEQEKKLNELSDLSTGVSAASIQRVEPGADQRGSNCPVEATSVEQEQAAAVDKVLSEDDKQDSLKQ